MSPPVTPLSFLVDKSGKYLQQAIQTMFHTIYLTASLQQKPKEKEK